MKNSNRPKKIEYKNNVTIGSWLTIPHPSVAEILSKSGFDWLTVDLEHSGISIETASEIIRVIDLVGIKALVRVGDHNPNVIKRVMDSGAHGVIVSTVNTVNEAKNIVDAVKYPPKGTRGVGLSRAQGYAQEFDEYYKWLNEESLVIVQIEHIKGVENINDILFVEGVDGYFIGPYDLSASIGVPGDFNNPRMIEALNEINAAKKEVNCISGIHVVQPIISDVEKRINEGYNMIAYGLDYLFMTRNLKKDIKSLTL